MRFADIPQYTSSPGYQVDVPWVHLERHLAQLREWDLELDPDFQRPHVWTRVQQVAYVEHVLRGGWSSRLLLFNCPGWHQGGRGIVLVDGKQRLEAARAFMRGDLRVFGGQRCEDFDGPMDVITASFRFGMNDLPDRPSVLRWYLEFNSGGTPHAPEEILRVKELYAGCRTTSRRLPPEHEQAGREFPVPGDVVGVFGLEEHDEHTFYPYVVARLDDEGNPVVLCNGTEYVVDDPYQWGWLDEKEDLRAGQADKSGCVLCNAARSCPYHEEDS